MAAIVKMKEVLTAESYKLAKAIDEKIVETAEIGVFTLDDSTAGNSYTGKVVSVPEVIVLQTQFKKGQPDERTGHLLVISATLRDAKTGLKMQFSMGAEQGLQIKEGQVITAMSVKGGDKKCRLQLI